MSSRFSVNAKSKVNSPLPLWLLGTLLNVAVSGTGSLSVMVPGRWRC